MDAVIRELERRAHLGDEAATAALVRHRERAESRPILRSFSAYGPCIFEGRLIRETSARYIVEARCGAGRTEKRRFGKASRFHLAPCKSCVDHPQTNYPTGYQG